MKIVKYYPYRTGFVYGVELPRELMKDLEKLLHALNGSSIDNHVCFQLVNDNGRMCAVMFHDFVCYVGEIVTERKW